MSIILIANFDDYFYRLSEIPRLMKLVNEAQLAVFPVMLLCVVVLVFMRPPQAKRVVARCILELAIVYAVFLVFVMFSAHAETFLKYAWSPRVPSEMEGLYTFASDTCRMLSYMVWGGYFLWIARRVARARGVEGLNAVESRERVKGKV